MKVHKVTLLVIDFDDIGEAGVKEAIENASYGNDCIHPEVKNVETREIKWSDNHPLNLKGKCDDAYRELFGENKKEGGQDMSDKNEKWNGLMGCRGKPMDVDTSKLFLTLTMLEMNINAGKAEASIVDKMETDLDGHFPYQVLKTRLEAFKKSCSPTMDIGRLPQIFCGLISDRPGKSVMWAYTLNEIFVKTGKPVTMEALTQEFPWGFPTEDEMSQCWDKQKCERVAPFDTDNSVDSFSTWSLPKQG